MLHLSLTDLNVELVSTRRIQYIVNYVHMQSVTNSFFVNNEGGEEGRSRGNGDHRRHWERNVCVVYFFRNLFLNEKNLDGYQNYKYMLDEFVLLQIVESFITVPYTCYKYFTVRVTRTFDKWNYFPQSRGAYRIHLTSVSTDLKTKLLFRNVLL